MTKMHDKSDIPAFEQLLGKLSSDRDLAAEKYEELRFRITQILIWKGCLEGDADALTDAVFDRVGAKLAQGEVIENVSSYATVVARYIFLEHSRRHREIAVDALPEQAVEPDTDDIDGPDTMLRCLRKCLVEIGSDNDRKLIVSYYDNDSGEKTKVARKTLALSLGLSSIALKVKACRLRAKLEKCVFHCVDGETKKWISATYIR
jgi:DNA-directed RNA polymerase specialized sigma subunit, sigma24 homolog